MKQREFQRQRETIITWKDESGKDFALSFQDKLGARNTWFSICFLKGLQVSAVSNDEQSNGSETQNQQESEDIQEIIPFPSEDNLSEIVQELVDRDFYARRRIAETILKQTLNSEVSTKVSNTPVKKKDHNPDFQPVRYRPVFSNVQRDDSNETSCLVTPQRTPYLDQLQQIFESSEAGFIESKTTKDRNLFQQSVRNLHSLFQIYRNLIGLSNKDIIELLMKEHYWKTTFGALEYDPEVFLPMGESFPGDQEIEDPAPGSSSPAMLDLFQPWAASYGENY